MNQRNLVKFPGQGVPPTLESLPPELQLQICREMLLSEKPIALLPCKPYISGFAFGSLGILRVSKHFSTMALSVMYGENCFRLISKNCIIGDRSLKSSDPEDDGLEDEIEIDDDELHTVPVKSLRHGAWENLKNIPQTLFGKGVSSVDCLDMISQTSSGQKFLKRLQIDFSRLTLMRVMDGILLRILKRLRALQSVELDILRDWEDIVPDKEDALDDTFQEAEIWPERNAWTFLTLFREEMSHVKKITMGRTAYDWFDDTTIIDWMTDELKKRNEAWTPPLPSYKNFRRTTSSTLSMDTEIAKLVAEFDRSKVHEQTFARLVRLRGVF